MHYYGPIMRTYYSRSQYQQDAARMDQAGFQVMNVQADRITDGCSLTAVLIIGLLLTPVCSGLLILLVGLPMSFCTRITAYYIALQVASYESMPSAPQGIPAPLTRPLVPGRAPHVRAQYAPSADDTDSEGGVSGWLRPWTDQVREFMYSRSISERIALATLGIALAVVSFVVTAYLVQVVAR